MGSASTPMPRQSSSTCKTAMCWTASLSRSAAAEAHDTVVRPALKCGCAGGTPSGGLARRSRSRRRKECTGARAIVVGNHMPYPYYRSVFPKCDEAMMSRGSSVSMGVARHVATVGHCGGSRHCRRNALHWMVLLNAWAP